MSNAVIERRVAVGEMAALHRTMSAEILKLEGHVEAIERGQPRAFVACYLLLAVRLRDQLTSVSGPVVTLEAMPSIGRLVEEATLGAYRWAVAELPEVRHLVSGQRVLPRRSSPSPTSRQLEDLAVFHDLSRLCAAFGSVSTNQLARTLDAIDETLYRLIETRDRIEQVVRHAC